MKTAGRFTAGAIVAALVLSGCGQGGGTPDAGGAGDIPDNQAFVEYRPANNRYAIKVPEGWARTESADAATFTDKLNTVTVVLGSRATAPDAAAGTADLDALRGTTAGFSPGKVSVVDRNAGKALLVTYRADAPADPVTGKVVNDDVERYQFWQSSSLLTVTLAGPHGADNVDPWRTVTDSVRWLA
ncbi:hypothetical protein AB0K00_09570 [Dactylosporangium sp. NPDC049525]|uniref:hypothetical protein n=1 Tax=Dactylosporangium sp. NPDC049525 TaxID=3154730 RepID=UPI003430543E